MPCRPRLLACVAAALAGHALVGYALLHATASGLRRPPPHQTAMLRLVEIGAVAPPVPAQPPPAVPTADAAAAARAAPPQPAMPRPPALPEPFAVAVKPALAPERAPSAPASPQAITVAPRREFQSPAEVDRIALAFPGPDGSKLEGLHGAGVPMRLRLFIDASGRVVEVKVLESSDTSDVIQRVSEMFMATHFVPARKAGADVDSYKDIELTLGDAP